MSSVSGTRGAVFQLAGSGSLVFGVAAGAAMGVGRSGLAEPLGGCDPCGAELAADRKIFHGVLLFLDRVGSDRTGR